MVRRAKAAYVSHTVTQHTRLNRCERAGPRNHRYLILILTVGHKPNSRQTMHRPAHQAHQESQSESNCGAARKVRTEHARSSGVQGGERGGRVDRQRVPQRRRLLLRGDH